MTTDDRNFRSAYYEKVGCRSVEERKSLEILLKEKPLNRPKLKQFCLSFTVPAVYRNVLWNILLDVAPVHPDCHAFVMTQRREVFEDLHNALRVMHIISEQTPIPNVLYTMWLLENKQLRLGVNINNRCNFVIMSEALQQTFQNEVDLYWITKGFYKCALEISRDFGQLKELSYKLLEKENHTIYKHLDENNLLDALPLEQWYGTCFAGVLTNQSLIRIWDKICGGSRKIVVFVFVTLFSWIWRTARLSSATQVPEIITIIDNLKDNQESADHIVNNSIELWQKKTPSFEF
ncbi:TBC1 domain family member 7 [Sitodiplosis mosellana]|uniref:TBC1 domain family member 7 n=1 Tax=Sitodiplosis mosellana TaxID=263140 RepID=UPI002444611E|nr:TBC1 domain family member 7 [Sitodiplosis mosellana]